VIYPLINDLDFTLFINKSKELKSAGFFS
jgi:hypothetical protein